MKNKVFNVSGRQVFVSFPDPYALSAKVAMGV
jgi:hypothetical protein